MAKRFITLALLFVAAALPTVAETWYVEPASFMYNQFQGSETTVNVKIRISRSDSTGQPKDFYLLVTGANLESYEVGSRRIYLNGNSASDYLSVKLKKTSTSNAPEISTPNSVGTKTMLTGSISGTETTLVVPFKVNIPADSSYTMGTYTNFFTFSLYVGTSTYNPSLSASAAGTFNIGVAVTSSGFQGSIVIYPSLLYLGTLPNSGTANMLVTGVKRFKVYVSSANQGKLKLTGSDSEIPYTLVVDSSATVPVNVNSFPFPDPIVTLEKPRIVDRLYTLTVTTAVLDFPEAGDYSDILTFSFVQP